jgi:hypothetical protein
MNSLPSQTALVPSPGATCSYSTRELRHRTWHNRSVCPGCKRRENLRGRQWRRILRLRGDNTTVIDAEGRRLIPGINDSHTHLINEKASNYNVKWDGVPTLARALEMLREQAKRTPTGQWVKVIGGWSPDQFSERRMPTLEELKAAVPDRPFIVQYAYNQLS